MAESEAIQTAITQAAIHVATMVVITLKQGPQQVPVWPMWERCKDLGMVDQP